MRMWMRAAVVALAGLAAVGCGSATDVKPPIVTTPGEPFGCNVTVKPASANLQVGDVLAFTAIMPSGSTCGPGRVTWVSSSPNIASVDSSGLVRALSSGATSIIARAVADPTIVGAGVVQVGPVATPPSIVLTIQSINEVGPPSGPANLSSVNSAIDVALTLGANAPVRDFHLIANDGARDTTVATTPMPAASGNQNTTVHLIWNTAARNADGTRAFANGGYTIRVIATDTTTQTSFSTSRVQLVVFNP